MLVGVARTSTGCESQPNFGHATFTNVAYWNNWIRETIEKRENSIYCLEPFRISLIDSRSTNFQSATRVSNKFIHIRLNLEKRKINSDMKTIFQCKLVRYNQCYTKCDTLSDWWALWQSCLIHFPSQRHKPVSILVVNVWMKCYEIELVKFSFKIIPRKV